MFKERLTVTFEVVINASNIFFIVRIFGAITCLLRITFIRNSVPVTGIALVLKFTKLA